MPKFALEIGDWSGDGHGLSKTVVIDSNKSFEEVSLADSRILEVTGIEVGDICSEYDEITLNSETVEKLKKLGFDFDLVEIEITEEDYCPSPNGIIDIWLFLLMKTDPSLHLVLVEDERSILRHKEGFIGYGAFII